MAACVSFACDSILTLFSAIFRLLQVGGDIEDLEQILGKPEGKWRRMMGSGSCSAFIKPLSNGKDLLFSHVTWSGYQSMLRVQKFYSFSYSDGSESELISNTE